MFRFCLLCVLLIPAALCTAESPRTIQVREPAELVDTKLVGTKNVHRAGHVLLAGQPNEAAVRELAKNGCTTIITLRHIGEERWKEEELCKELGITFVRLPIGKPEDIDAKLIDKTSAILNAAAKDNEVLLHCASANRVGAVWMAYRVKEFAMDQQTALKEAKRVGLSWMELGEQALKVVQE